MHAEESDDGPLDTVNDVQALPPRKQAIPLFLALTAAGAVGNYYGYEIFFDIHFIFGSIFALLALQLLGFGPGLLAAVVISSVTYLIWNHPYAIVTMSCEVLAVGWLNTRKNVGIVFADALYWLCLGIPLVFLFYSGIMDLSISTTVITSLKQSMNGIANALLARLLFMALSFRSRKRLFSIREVMFNMLALFVLAPSLLLLSIEIKTEFSDTDQAIRQSLSRASKRVSDSLETWLEGQANPIVHLAKIAGSHSVSDLQRSIDDAHAMSREFLRMGLLDKNATIVAFSPRFDEFGQSNIGKNFADRPFIPLLKQTLKPMLSEVVMGRIGTPKPMVTILAPVVTRGAYAGYVTGILDLQQVKALISLNAPGQSLPELHYTLLDKNNRIIITNRENLKVMELFVRAPGDLIRLGDGIQQRIPVSRKNIAFSDRWMNSYYIVETGIGPLAEWKLVLEQPVAPFQKKLYKKYAGQLILVFLIILSALVVAEILSRKIIKPLNKLTEISTGLPDRLSTGENIAWAGSALLETERLLVNFRDMANALSDKFNEIRRMNVSLEARVREKTRDLQESEERYRNLFENNLSVMLIIDPENGAIVDANPAASAYYGWTREELKRRKITEINRLQPEELAAEMALARAQTRNHFFFQHRRSDGTIRDVEVYSGPVLTSGKTLLLSIVHDITERKQAERLLSEISLFNEQMLTTLSVGVASYDAEGKCVSCNDAAARLIGVSREAFMLQNFRLLESWKKSGLLEAADKTLSSGVASRLQVHIVTSFGKDIWLDCIFSRFFSGAGGKPHLLVVFSDVSAAKHAEELIKDQAKELQSILDTLSVGVAHVKDRSILWANASFDRIFGYEPGETRGMGSLLLYADSEGYGRIGREGYARLSAGKTYSTEARMKKKDGSLFWGGIVGRAIDPGSPDAGSIWMFQDITDRKQAEEALQEKTLQLEDVTRNLEKRVTLEIAQRMKNEQLLVQQSKLAAMGEMIGAIAHQWRQPLNILGLIVQNAQDAFAHGELDKAYMEGTVQKAMAQIQHMSKTIDDFRNFFMPDKERTVFDTMRAVGDVLSLFSAQLAANDIGYTLTCHTHGRTFDNQENIVPCEEKFLEGFRNEFEHVILNLINNAKDAILDRREKDLTARAERGSVAFDFYQAEGRIIIMVSDNGGGIPKEALNRIFEPYFTTKDHSRGTGLGLYMSKVIIEDHMQGKLSARNHAHGATFIIELPLSEKEA